MAAIAPTRLRRRWGGRRRNPASGPLPQAVSSSAICPLTRYKSPWCPLAQGCLFLIICYLPPNSVQFTVVSTGTRLSFPFPTHPSPTTDEAQNQAPPSPKSNSISEGLWPAERRSSVQRQVTIMALSSGPYSYTAVRDDHRASRHQGNVALLSAGCSRLGGLGSGILGCALVCPCCILYIYIYLHT